ncbi:MAG: hypothetical protein JXR84_27550, partial [Anaerolineae bacterium]|nr:hypothetical protein [Anaerolineae bacterium]
FHRLWAQMCTCVRARVEDLADLFQGFPKNWHPDEVQRLIDVYNNVLSPLIGEHFSIEQQALVTRSLKCLIVLRLLEVPYRAGEPIEADTGVVQLLLKLHMHCRGYGLMIWQENGAQVFVVETEQDLYIDWVIRRMTAFIQRRHRDKAVSDAIWATLFSQPDHSNGRERYLLPASPGQRLLCVSGDLFPNREGVLVKTSLTERWVLIFESPWEPDRGHRVRGAIQQLPDKVTSEQVWIWEPRVLSPAETQIVLRYIAAGRALRYALLEYAQGRGVAWIIAALRRKYTSVCPLAMRTLLACFDEGIIVSDGGVYNPRRGEQSLIPTLEALAAWMRPANEESPVFYHEPAGYMPYPDRAPFDRQGHELVTYIHDQAHAMGASLREEMS